MITEESVSEPDTFDRFAAALGSRPQLQRCGTAQCAQPGCLFSVRFFAFLRGIKAYIKTSHVTFCRIYVRKLPVYKFERFNKFTLILFSSLK